MKNNLPCNRALRSARVSTLFFAILCSLHLSAAQVSNAPDVSLVNSQASRHASQQFESIWTLALARSHRKLDVFWSPAVTATLIPSSRTVGVTNVSLVGTATPGATVSETETWPDGTVHGPFTAVASSSGNYTMGPFILQQLGTYNGIVRDLSNGSQTPVSYSASGDFSVSRSPSSRTINPGQSASFTVTFTSVSGFAGTVIPAALNWGNIPNSTASWSPSQVTVPSGGSTQATFTIQTSSNTTPGTYSNVILRGANGSVTRSSSASTVTVSAPTVNLTAALCPSNPTVGVTNVSICGNATPGATVTENPDIWPDGTVHGPFSTTANASGTYSMGPFILQQLGQYQGTIRDSLSGQQIPFNYSGQGNFSATVSPSTRTVTAGQPASYTVTFNSISGFAGTVIPAAVNWSQIPGATASWSPSQVSVPSNGSVQATFTIQTAGSTTPGTYSGITLQGANGSQTRTAPNVSLVVNPSTPTLTAVLCPANPIVGVTNVSICGTATPNSTVTENPDIWPDGTVHGPFSTMANSSGNYVMGPFILQQLGQYSGTIRDSISGQQIPFLYSGQGNFSASVNATNRTVTSGQMATYTVTFNSIGGFAGTVIPAAVNWSQIPGVSAFWNPAQIYVPSNGSAQSTFAIQTQQSTPASTYSNITLQGANGSQTRSASPVSLTVNGPVLSQSINEIQPNTVTLNTRTKLVVRGTNFGSPFLASVVTPAGTFNIDPSETQYVSPNELWVWVNMGGGVGYNATLRINFTLSSLTRALSVVPSTPAPTIEHVTSPVIKNQVARLTIDGTNFKEGFKAYIISPDCVPSCQLMSGNKYFRTANKVEVDVVMQGSPPYNATVKIENPDGQSASGGFQVVAQTQPPSTPLQVEGIEVTQGIQDIDSSFQTFIQGRSTYVRVHVKSISQTIQNVQANLTVRRNGQLLRNLMASNPGRTSINVVTSPKRTSLNDSLLFRIPDEFLNGTLDLELIDVSHDIGCPSWNSECKRKRITFGPETKLEVTLVKIDCRFPVGMVSDSELSDVEKQLKAYLPVSDIRFTRPIELVLPFGCSPIFDAEKWRRVNDMLGDLRINCGSTNSCARKYLGIMPASQFIDVIALGGTVGQVPYLAAPWGAAFWIGETPAHEVAHMLARPHTEVARNEACYVLDYPYAGGLISGEQSNRGLHGFNVLTQEIYSYSSKDLMGYGSGRHWASDYTWHRIRQFILNPNELPTPPPYGNCKPSNRIPHEAKSLPPIVVPANSEMVIVRGTVGQASNEASIRTVFRTTATVETVIPNEGSFSVRYGNAGGLLAEYFFEPSFSPNGDPSSVELKFPFNPNATRFAIVHDGVELASRSATNNSPTITVTHPNGGGMLIGETLNLQWSASDADADSLKYWIQYSSSAGAVWETVASGLEATSHEIRLNSLTGTTQGLIRVIASDGFHSASDQSDAPFSISAHAPQPSISAPLNNSYFVGDQNFVLSGSAFDLEDGQLDDSSITWSSNLEGSLGSGRSLSINAGSLQEGTHVITLTARDTSQQTGTATVSVRIYRTQPTLPASLSASPGTLSFIAQAGTSNPTAAQVVAIRNDGDGTINWSANTNQPWIQISSAGGTTPSNPDIRINPTGLGLGNYSGTITLTSPNASNGPQVVYVTLSIVSYPVLQHETPFDFDGDGKTDVGIFRPSVGEWWIYQSGNAQVRALQFGASTDKIAPADFTGDGKTDVAFWRPATGEWFVIRSDDNTFYSGPFGTSGDIPVPADYDADGKADVAVFRPSTGYWFVQRSSNGVVTSQLFGTSGDHPIAADYDGDGRADVAIYRPSVGEWWLSRTSAGVIAYGFGNSSDKIVPGDYTGDGRADVAFWRPATGEWFILRSEDTSYYSAPFGIGPDIPTPGDYDGDGKFDVAVFRPSIGTWFVNRTSGGASSQQFGANGDRPIPNAFVP